MINSLYLSSIFAHLCNAEEGIDLIKISSTEPSYSELMREVTKKYPPEILKQLRITFKETFDNALLDNVEKPEKLALDAAHAYVDSLEHRLSKAASAIEMGDPAYAGKYIAEIIKFLMRRISADSRPNSMLSLKKKISDLNEGEIASKNMPASSAIGQSINLTKQLLLSHSPDYIRDVINSIVRNL